MPHYFTTRKQIIIKDVPEDQADYHATEEALIDFGNGVEYKVSNWEHESSEQSSFLHCLELLEKARVIEVVDTRTKSPVLFENCK
jgi:hypothetical protein